MDKNPPPAPAELTIGEFASMCRLTVRALHHYDHIGLLHPSRVDPANGYRYYEVGQLVSASTIAVLRGLDIDVETIGNLLGGSRTLGDVLAAERARREEEARRAAASLAVLESLERTTSGEPRVVDSPPMSLVGVSLSVLAMEEIVTIGRAFSDLFTAAQTAHVDHDPDGICIIRKSTREQLHIDVAIRPNDATSSPPTGYRNIVIEGGSTASVLHHGPLESLPLAHAGLNGWILERGMKPAGSARETYVGDLSDQQTRVEVPVDLG